MFASTAFGQLRYIRETTPGVVPVTGTARNLRTTGPNMKAGVQSIVSDEIRPERMVISSTNVDLTVDGGFDIELSSREYDDFIAGVLCGVWRDYGTNGASAAISLTTTANTVVAGAATTGVDDFSNLRPGQWFKLLPDASASDAVKSYFADKWLRVSETTAATSTVITLDTATPLDGVGIVGTAMNFKVLSSVASNGNERSSFSLEWEQTDVNQFVNYVGMRPNTLSLDFAVGAMLKGSLGFLGMRHGITQVTVLPGGPSFTPSFGGEVMNSVTDMGILRVGGQNVLAGGTSFVQSIKLEINNNLRGQKALGVFGNANVGYGEFAVSGTMECYFENHVLYEKALAGEIIDLALGIADVNGNGYLIDMPKIKFKDSALNLGSKDSDVMVSLPFQAFYDLSKGRGISITRASAL